MRPIRNFAGSPSTPRTAVVIRDHRTERQLGAGNVEGRVRARSGGHRKRPVVRGSRRQHRHRGDPQRGNTQPGGDARRYAEPRIRPHPYSRSNQNEARRKRTPADQILVHDSRHRRQGVCRQLDAHCGRSAGSRESCAVDAAQAATECLRTQSTRQPARCDPCGGEPRGSHGRRGCACAGGSRAPSHDDGCSAGTSACPWPR